MPSWHCSRISCGARGGRQRPRDLGLAHARLALQQQRLLQREGEVGGGGEALVGEVALAGQGAPSRPAATYTHRSL